MFLLKTNIVASNLTDDSTSVGTIEADSPGNDPVDQDDGEDEEDDEEADDDDDDDVKHLFSNCKPKTLLCFCFVILFFLLP